MEDTLAISAKLQFVRQSASIQALASHQTNATAHSLTLVLCVKLNFAQGDVSTVESALTLSTAFAIVLELGTPGVTALFLNALKTVETRPVSSPICVHMLLPLPLTLEAISPTATVETTFSPLMDVLL